MWQNPFFVEIQKCITKSQYQLKNILTDCFSTDVKTVPVFQLSYFLFLIFNSTMTRLYFIVFYCCVLVCHHYSYYRHQQLPLLRFLPRSLCFKADDLYFEGQRPPEVCAAFWPGSVHCRLSAGPGCKQLSLRVLSSSPAPCVQCLEIAP